MALTNLCKTSLTGRMTLPMGFGARITRWGTRLARHGCVCVLSVFLALPALAGAQSAKDSALYAQAQQKVANGDAAGGRKLADSVANAAQTGTAAYAEGLYWRATLAANARDSEHAYRQIIVDYPLSARVPDALLRIGQLESARGENAAALQHFQRLVLEHPQSPLRPEASYWVARMYFDANDPSHACAANTDATSSVPASNVELKNRIDFQQQRCRGVTLATNAAAANTPAANTPAAAAPASAPTSAPANNVPVVKATKPPVKPVPKVATAVAEHRDTIAKRAEAVVTPSAPSESASAPVTAVTTSTASAVPATSSGNGSTVVSRPPTKEEVDRALASAAQSKLMTKTPPAAKTAKASTTKAPATPAAKSASPEPSVPSGGFAVQIAAFATKGPATQMATNLRGRGYEAYVDGTSAPYRVRIGHYTTHAAAARELVKLKAKHIDGFVAER